MRKLLLILLFLSCAVSEENYQKKYVLYCELDPYFKYQRIIFDSTYRVDAPITDTAGISGADIFLISQEGETIKFEEIQDSIPGVYFSKDTFCIKPSQKYYLYLQYKEFSLKDSVFIPGDFKILTWKDGDTISEDSIPELLWTHSDSASIYYLLIYPEDTSLWLFIHENIAEITSKDTFVEPQFVKPYLESLPSNTQMILKIRAVDKNLEKYGTGFYSYDCIPNPQVIGVIGASLTKEIKFTKK